MGTNGRKDEETPLIADDPDAIFLFKTFIHLINVILGRKAGLKLLGGLKSDVGKEEPTRGAKPSAHRRNKTSPADRKPADESSARYRLRDFRKRWFGHFRFLCKGPLNDFWIP